MKLYDKATLKSIPCLIKINKIEEPNNTLLILIKFIGIMVFLIGLYTLFAGPEIIYYDRALGPNFFNMFKYIRDR